MIDKFAEQGIRSALENPLGLTQINLLVENQEGYTKHVRLHADSLQEMRLVLHTWLSDSKNLAEYVECAYYTEDLSNDYAIDTMCVDALHPSIYEDFIESFYEDTQEDLENIEEGKAFFKEHKRIYKNA